MFDILLFIVAVTVSIAALILWLILGRFIAKEMKADFDKGNYTNALIQGCFLTLFIGISIIGIINIFLTVCERN